MKILDEGKFKYVSESIEMVKFNNWYLQCKNKNLRVLRVSEWSDEKADYIWKEIPNENQREPPPRIIYAMKKYSELAFLPQNYEYWEKLTGVQLDKKFLSWAGGENTVYEYLDIIPFTPSVMINISPDWKKGKISLPNRIKKLKELINCYMSEGWFQKWSYVIENGSEGNHIHAHCVCEFNRGRLKSTETHIAKGNHTRQLAKYAKKIEGMEGVIKGVSVQKCVLRTETLVKDKLNYLQEDLKPEGHKNKSIIVDGFITGSL